MRIAIAIWMLIVVTACTFPAAQEVARNMPAMANNKNIELDPGADMPEVADLPATLLENPMEHEEVVDPAAPMLSIEEQKRSDWATWVGDELGIWISIPRQELRLIKNCQVLWTIPCATAAKGVGARLNTNQTPPGWHKIVEKIGDGKPKGQVFRSKKATEEIWKPGQKTPKDLVLTRIFILDGQQKGINREKDAEGIVVDSLQRLIYMHGTNDEAHIGTPSSQGCIRLLNNDIIALYDEVPTGTPVYIEAPREQPPTTH